MNWSALLSLFLVFIGSGALPVNGGTSNSSPKADFFVATNGDDGWSGTLPAPNPTRTDGPFATVDKARLAAQGLVRSKPITIMLRGGTYYQTSLAFTSAD